MAVPQAGAISARLPCVSLSYGLAMVAVSYMLVLGLSSIGLFYLVLPMVAGFMLVGPIVAVGLYEVSRLHNMGREARLSDAFGAFARNAGQISAIGLVLMLMLLFWVRVALLIFALFFSYQPPTLEGFVNTVFFTEQGLIFLVVGSVVGGMIATVVFAVTALSIPMLLDRDTDLFTAVATSVRGVMENWQTMAGLGRADRPVHRRRSGDRLHRPGTGPAPDRLRELARLQGDRRRRLSESLNGSGCCQERPRRRV